MIIGRLEESLCDAWPCWPLSASTSGTAECAPTPAATAPSTDVFTKSRRENVTSPPGFVRLPPDHFWCERRNLAAGPGSITRDGEGCEKAVSPAVKGYEQEWKGQGSLHALGPTTGIRSSSAFSGWRTCANVRDRRPRLFQAVLPW